MATESEQPAVIRKEMGLTHEEFYSKLPVLLDGVPYRQSKDSIRVQLDRKNLEITLAPENSRQLSRSISLPVTVMTLQFFDFSKAEIEGFIQHFNLTFMKGGG